MRNLTVVHLMDGEKEHRETGDTDLSGS
jgi:hypothetical protein